MTRVGDDTACVPTQSDLIDALAGRCQVSVLLVDSIPAVRLVSTESDDEEAVLGLASPDGSAWRYATGQTETLRRGEYELPSSNGEPQSAVTLRLAAMAGINLPKGLGLLRVVVARDATYYLLGKRMPRSPLAEQKFVAAMGLPESATLLVKRIEVDRCAAMQAPASEPQAQPATYAPIGADSNSRESPGPKPLTTGEIAFCFAGLRWDTEKKWKDALGKQRGWMEACVAVPAGGRGRGAAPKLWNPVMLAAALVRSGYIKPNSARARFQTTKNQSLLGPWLDAWKTYEADNFATD